MAADALPGSGGGGPTARGCASYLHRVQRVRAWVSRNGGAHPRGRSGRRSGPCRLPRTRRHAAGPCGPRAAAAVGSLRAVTGRDPLGPPGRRGEHGGGRARQAVVAGRIASRWTADGRVPRVWSRRGGRASDLRRGDQAERVLGAGCARPPDRPRGQPVPRRPPPCSRWAGCWRWRGANCAST